MGHPRQKVVRQAPLRIPRAAGRVPRRNKDATTAMARIWDAAMETAPPALDVGMGTTSELQPVSTAVFISNV